MKSKKRRGIPMMIIVLGMIFVILFSFLVAVSYVGYRQFTNKITAQYSENAVSIANSASSLVEPSRLKVYLENKGQCSDFFELYEIFTQMCSNLNATYIYIIEPDVSKNYEEITFVVSTVNENKNLDPFEVGYTMKTTNEDYRASYQKIYEESLESAIVVRDKGLRSGAKPHITALVPIKDDTGNVIGILAAERPMSYLNEARGQFLNGIIIAGMCIFVLMFLVFSVCTYLIIIKPIRNIAGETERFASENKKSEEELITKVSNVREIKTLAFTIDDMEKKTLDYFNNLTIVTAEKERLGSELYLARSIQAACLPSDFPAFPERKEFDIFATMDPAKEVGGDFYDFFLLDDDHLALVIADVSGKGIPAALFMMISKTLIKDHSRYFDSPKKILEEVNEVLCKETKSDMFVTAWMGILEISTGKLTAANAGHEFPSLKRKDGSFKLIKDKHGLVLAGMEGSKYSEYEISLEPGDILYVYTDGVAEATNSSEELFGTDRMLQALNNSSTDDLTGLLTNVRKEIDEFVKEAPQFDDITMLGLKYTGTFDI